LNKYSSLLNVLLPMSSLESRTAVAAKIVPVV